MHDARVVAPSRNINLTVGAGALFGVVGGTIGTAASGGQERRRQSSLARLAASVRIMALDPTFPPPYGAAAACLMWRRANYWPADFISDDAELLRLFNRVKELNTDDAVTLVGIGFALCHNRVDFDAGLEIDRASAFRPI